MSPIKTRKPNTQVNEITQEESKSAAMGEKLDTSSEYKIIIENGEAAKLSPKSSGKIYFEMAHHQIDGCNYLRIKGNESGGLHSLEWVSLEKVIATLAGQVGNPFKSTVFPP
jgi:hypothetical protein